MHELTILELHALFLASSSDGGLFISKKKYFPSSRKYLNFFEHLRSLITVIRAIHSASEYDKGSFSSVQQQKVI